MTRKYDIIIFGATAYTGQFVVEEVTTVIKQGQKLSWAVAGRSEKKLQNVLKQATIETGQDLTKVDIIIADVDNVESLRKMTKQTKVLVTIVGPYTLYGENVVKACVAEGTSCVDLSGEANFLETMQLKYNDQAEKSGCYIIGAYGFDSIPSDCGVTLLQKKFEGGLNSVEMFLEMDYAGKPPPTHYGTYHSGLQLFMHEHELEGFRKLLFSKPTPVSKYPLQDHGLLHYSKEVKGWCVPFPGVDESIVKRSQYRLYNNKQISAPSEMKAYVKLPLILCIFAIIGAYIFKFMLKFSLGRHILINYPKLCTLGMISHEGAEKADLNDFVATFTLAGSGWTKKGQQGPPDSRVNVKVKCRDPAYSATSTLLVQAAVTIVTESDKIPGRGGVYSPGAAFAETSLIERINARGLQFGVDK